MRKVEESKEPHCSNDTPIHSHILTSIMTMTGYVPKKHSTVDSKSISNSHGPRWCSQLGLPRDDPRVGSGT